jgi:DNA-binding transcriptional LysR family regulator
MPDPIETAELLAFARIVQTQSLTRAAAELKLPRATVSRRLQRLEERLGVRLLRRTTRRLALTDAGEVLYRHARVILDAVHDAALSVQGTDAVRGRLRVSVPPGLPQSFHSLLCDFTERYPDVRMEVHASARHVNLIAEGYDVALRAGVALDSGLVGRTLQRSGLVAVASPDYLARRGTPKSVRELPRHDCLMAFSRGEVPQSQWPLLDGGSVRLDGTLFSNDVFLLTEAARRGRGIALLPTTLTDPLVVAGELVPVLDRVLGAETLLMLVYPERELVLPAVRAFIDVVAAWVEQNLSESAASLTAPEPKPPCRQSRER